jgi:hypothetical protein
METNRMIAAALAAVGAVSAFPIPLAQLDFAGVVNVFGVDAGDSPRALLVLAGIGGALTIVVLGAALLGAALALAGSPSSRPVLIGAALAGMVTAPPLWLPTGVVIGAAAVVLAREREATAQASA